jgi:hypothetical protein
MWARMDHKYCFFNLIRGTYGYIWNYFKNPKFDSSKIRQMKILTQMTNVDLDEFKKLGIHHVSIFNNLEYQILM